MEIPNQGRDTYRCCLETKKKKGDCSQLAITDSERAKVKRIQRPVLAHDCCTFICLPVKLDVYFLQTGLQGLDQLLADDLDGTWTATITI